MIVIVAAVNMLFLSLSVVVLWLLCAKYIRKGRGEESRREERVEGRILGVRD